MWLAVCGFLGHPGFWSKDQNDWFFDRIFLCRRYCLFEKWECVNECSKLSKKYSRPATSGFLTTVTSHTYVLYKTSTFLQTKKCAYHEQSQEKEKARTTESNILFEKMFWRKTTKLPKNLLEIKSRAIKWISVFQGKTKYSHWEKVRP